MTSEEYPDLFNAAAHSASRDLVQVASVMAVLARHAAQRQARKARLAEQMSAQAHRTRLTQEHAERAAARAAWSPANDPTWLQKADLVGTASAWAAAVRYPDDPAAVSAIRNCEARLRELHPSAMAQYDRLRTAGLGPISAMRRSVLLFGRRPARERPAAAARPVLSPGNGLGYTWTAAVHRPTRDDLVRELQRRRAVLIGEHIQRSAGTTVVSAGELRVRLDALTNLPADLIDEAVAARSVQAMERSPRPWRQDFPFPIEEVVAAAAERDRVGPVVSSEHAPGIARKMQPAGQPSAQASRR